MGQIRANNVASRVISSHSKFMSDTLTLNLAVTLPRISSRPDLGLGIKRSNHRGPEAHGGPGDLS